MSQGTDKDTNTTYWPVSNSPRKYFAFSVSQVQHFGPSNNCYTLFPAL